MPPGPKITLKGSTHRTLHAEAYRRGLTISKALDEAIELWVKATPKAEVDLSKCSHPIHRQSEVADGPGVFKFYCDIGKGGCGIRIS